ncbi:MAG: HIT family protein [Nocardioidaceae bacterium]
MVGSMVDGCLFCRIVAGREPAYVVWRDEATTAFLDTRPVFKGHVLLVTRTHVDTLMDAPTELLTPLFAVAQRLAAAMVDVSVLKDRLSR